MSVTASLGLIRLSSSILRMLLLVVVRLEVDSNPELTYLV